VQQGGGWLVQQADLTPETLATQWLGLDRAQLQSKAEAAWNQKKINATQAVVAACEELAQ
jgi:UDP-N-acetylglucosamine--N-acetylmuramyl-(pentapeptide) pyrophosphoryl-undecaprenol N-acetylglucosamine transferase